MSFVKMWATWPNKSLSPIHFKSFFLLPHFDFSEPRKIQTSQERKKKFSEPRMVISLQVPVSTSLPSSSSSSSWPCLGPRSLRTFCHMNAKAKAKIPFPPINPNDPFLSKLASVAAKSPETLLNRPANSETPPFMDLFDSPKLMATPAHVLSLSHL